MDGSDDSGVSEAEQANRRLLDAMNEQVVPQLRALTAGPLFTGALQTVRGCLEHQQSVTGTLLAVRLMLDGRLFDLAVQVVVTPPES